MKSKSCLICVSQKEDIAWHKLAEAGNEPVHIKRNKFMVIRRRDMKHEDANHYVAAVWQFIHSADLTNQVILMTPVHGCTIINIHAMYESIRMILFPACWLLIDWLAGIQWQTTWNWQRYHIENPVCRAAHTSIRELKWSGGWSTGTVGWLSASERGHDLDGWPAMNTKCLVPLPFLPDLILWSTENRSHGSPVLVPPETQ